MVLTCGMLLRLADADPSVLTVFFFTYMFVYIILLCAYVEMNVMTVSQKNK